MKTLMTLTLAGAVLLTSGAASAGSKSKHKPVDCYKIAAAMEESGGSKSSDEIATQLKTTRAHVDKCMATVDKANKAKKEKTSD